MTRASSLLALLLLAASASPSAAQTSLPSGVNDRLVVGGLDFPVGLAQLPDGRTLVVEQKSARIRLIVGGQLAAVDPVCTVDAVQTAGTEQGLLGIAVDPGWPARPYVYIHCDQTGSSTIRVSRYRVAGDLDFTGNGALSIDTATRFDLVNDVPDVASNHNGGTLRFGPDGRLYASFGEDANACAAQDTTTLRGVILRLEVSGLPDGPGSATRAQVTPADNPFAGSSNLNRRLMWAKGLRNPFRFHIDPADGALFIADVGAGQWEEIDRAAVGGLQFGWPIFEGPDPLTSCPSNLPSPVAPIHYYDRSAGSAAVVSGGVYRVPPGATQPFPPDFVGDYFFSDYYFGFLRRLSFDGGVWTLVPGVNAADWATGFEDVSDYLVGHDGALWYCRQSVAFAANSGQIRRLTFGNDTSVTPPAPRVRFAPPFPSPGPGYTTFSYSLPVAARVRLRVFDARGRRVRTVVPLSVRPTPGDDVTWNGRDDDGVEVPAGLYFALLEVDGHPFTRRIALLR
jgi:glucose/arabinose dehydrogenase